jgi:hypothetical protein
MITDGMEQTEAAVNRLVDEYRSRCLWFLRPDYYPMDMAQRVRVLGQIQKNGDRTAFLKAAELRQCLSRASSAGSASS